MVLSVISLDDPISEGPRWQEGIPVKCGDVREYRSSCSRMESQGEPGNSLRCITSLYSPIPRYSGT